MSIDDRRYSVTLCATCSHPGGQHRYLNGWDNPAECVLCECKHWEAGGRGWWTHADTRRLAEGRRT